MVKFQTETLLERRIKKRHYKFKIVYVFPSIQFFASLHTLFVSAFNGFNRNVCIHTRIYVTYCQSQSSPNWIKINWLPNSLFRYTSIDWYAFGFFFSSLVSMSSVISVNDCNVFWSGWCGRRIVFTASHIKGDCQVVYHSSIALTMKSDWKSEKIHIPQRIEHKQAMNNQVALSSTNVEYKSRTHITRKYIKSIWFIIKNLGAAFCCLQKGSIARRACCDTTKRVEDIPRIGTFLAHTHKRQLRNWQIVNRITWHSPMSIHLLSIVWYAWISIRRTKIEWYYILVVSFFVILPSFLKGVACMGF